LCLATAGGFGIAFDKDPEGGFRAKGAQGRQKKKQVQPYDCLSINTAEYIYAIDRQGG
jgi:hypothetical protein